MEQQDYDDLKKRVEKLEQEYAELKGQTEPIKITRLEIDPGGMQELLVQANKRLERIIQTQTDRSEKFDTLEHGLQELKQELHTLSHNWLDTLQGNVDEIKHEMEGPKADIMAIKATESDHSELLKAMATKDDVSVVKQDVSTVKRDVSAVKQDISALKATQDRQEVLLQEILNRLPPKP